jgi:hypothetical protein
VKVHEGKALIRKFSQVQSEGGTPLGKVDGEKKRLSLTHAEELMSGYLS